MTTHYAIGDIYIPPKIELAPLATPIGYVYGLTMRDQKPEERAMIFYVGVTRDPIKRIMQHYRGDRQTKKLQRAFHCAQSHRCQVIMVMLEACPLDIMKRRELLWISALHKSGHDLLNQQGMTLASK